MISKYINPILIYKSLVKNINDLVKYSRYRKILSELSASKKLEEIGFSIDSKHNLYVGIDLNPELLLYSDVSQESVELKLIGEKLKKYNSFLTKEGIIDYVKVEYERIKNEDYYGYILQISYNFREYHQSSLIYAISYFSLLLISIGFIINTLIH